MVYTGQETKIKQNDTKKNKAKRSRMESQMNYQILYVFLVQLGIAVLGSFLNQVFDHYNIHRAYYLDIAAETSKNKHSIISRFPFLLYLLRIGTWLLLLTNFVPISLLVTVEMVKYIQAMFIEWDADMTSNETGQSAIV